MPAVSSFESGLYYPDHGADPVPAIVLETITPTATSSNRTVVSCIVFFTDGAVEVRTAIKLQASDPTAVGIGGHFRP